MTFFRLSDGTLMVREDDGTERPATTRERLDHDKDPGRWPSGPRDANETAFDVVRQATEGR